jgi:hypothetical protein
MKPRRIFTWRLAGNVPAKVNPADVIATIRYALHGWEKVCHVGFSQEYFEGQTDIIFRFDKPSRPEYTAERMPVGHRHVITFNASVKWRTFERGLGGWLKRMFAPGAKDLLTFTLQIGRAHV